MRQRIFRHVDGLAMGPTLCALAHSGMLAALRRTPEVSVGALAAGVARVQRGYLHVALRLLASQGWLAVRGQPATDGLTYALTDAGREALALAAHYERPVALLGELAFFDQQLVRGSTTFASAYGALTREALAGWGLTDALSPVVEQVRHHLDGMLIAPAMVALKASGVLDRFAPGVAVRPESELTESAFELLGAQGWLAHRGDAFEATPEGLFAFGGPRAWAYGVTFSYLPLLARLEALLYGDLPASLFGRDAEGRELHVRRALNVRASGAAHSTYFQKIDEIVSGIFSLPEAEQPAFICDMGSGDGTFLRHLYEVVREKTPRGQRLERQPLLMIGADFNLDAREATDRTLTEAAIPHRVVFGDVNDPDALAKELAALGVRADQGMHVRSFLDHNRPYTGVRDVDAAHARKARSTGAFAWLGRAIPNAELEQNLVEHFRRWAPHVARYGLLVLELHTLPAELAARNLGKTLATAYDATHGYSDQFTVEVEVFEACAREAGLAPDPRFTARFPPSELATVTIHLLRASGS